MTRQSEKIKEGFEPIIPMRKSNFYRLIKEAVEQREKEIIEMIEKLEKETAKNTGIDVSDVLIDGEELKAEIKGARK